MAYIYKKTIHGKPYYYLRVSKRINGKIIVKDIAYLGNDASKLTSQINNLSRKYKNEARKAYRNIKKFIQEEYYLKKIKKLKLKEDPFLDYRTLQEIEAIKLHYNKHFMIKEKNIVDETFKNFLVDFAFNTTSLEGNTITLDEANKLLKENLTPKNRTLMEIYDLQNTEKVFFDIINGDMNIDHSFIIKIHDELMKNIDSRKGYRTHDIRVFKSHFDASPYPYIKADIEILLKWYKKYKNKLHPFSLAAIFHQKFEKIHPFSDGNGRVGRIILSYMLIKGGYPPLIIRKSTRGRYLDSLSKGNKEDLNSNEPTYFKTLVQYFAKEMIFSYWRNFNI